MSSRVTSILLALMVIMAAVSAVMGSTLRDSEEVDKIHDILDTMEQKIKAELAARTKDRDSAKAVYETAEKAYESIAASSSSELSLIATMRNMLVNHIKVISGRYFDYPNDDILGVKGNAFMESNQFIPVDVNKKYKVEGEFMSMGEKPSRLYYGVSTYNKDKEFVSSWDVIRTGNDEVIMNFNDNSITVRDPINQEWNKAGAIAGQRTLGFYFDGNTNHLPDAVLYVYNDYYSTDAKQGTYSDASGNTIRLNAPLPASIANRIVKGKTVVKNHHAGGTYSYTAASYALVPANTWTKFEGTITGTGFGNSPSIFRPTTAYVRLLILANYQQDDSSEIVWRNLKISEVKN